jgi:hypothetical protein
MIELKKPYLTSVLAECVRFAFCGQSQETALLTRECRTKCLRIWNHGHRLAAKIRSVGMRLPVPAMSKGSSDPKNAKLLLWSLCDN